MKVMSRYGIDFAELELEPIKILEHEEAFQKAKYWIFINHRSYNRCDVL